MMMVFCVGMYRACSTWQYGVACQVLERHGGARRLGFIWGGDFDRKVDLAGLGGSRAVLKAHDAHPRFADELAAGRALGLYSHRDLRDVVFSWIHKTGSTFEELAEWGFFELCLENDRFWRAQPRMLVQSYAHLTAEPTKGVAEIAAHIGVGLAEADARAIADSLSFEANWKRTQAIAEQIRAKGQEPSTRDQSRYDPVSLLHWNHLREGRTGGWRELATPEQKGVMAHYFGSWLTAHGHEADDGWAPKLAPERLREATRRISYAPNREDILLDRLFAGRKGTYLDIDAPDPIRSNKTYYFYRRGWRGVNVGTGPGPRHRFVEDRPADLNLAIRLPYDPGTDEAIDGPPIRRVAELIAEHRVDPPEVVAFSVADDPGPILADLPLATWRPTALIVEARLALVEPEGYRVWEPLLLGLGYLPAAAAGPSRIYLRADLAGDLPALAGPVGVLDNYAPAEPPAEFDREGWLRERESRGAPTWPGEIAALLAERRALEAAIEHARADLRAEAAAREAAEARGRQEVEALGATLARESEAALDADRLAHAKLSRSEQLLGWAQRERVRLDGELRRSVSTVEALERALLDARHALLEAERALRPYRLVDHFGVVGSIYCRVRPLKRLLPPSIGLRPKLARPGRSARG